MLVPVEAMGVLVSFNLVLYACTMSILGAYFSRYCISVYTSWFWEVKLYLIASCFVITIDFTGSGWYLERTFMVLVGNSGRCRINLCRKHRAHAGSGESPTIDASSGGSFGVLISFYVILYTRTISITDTHFSTYFFSVYNSRFCEVKLHLIASCFVIPMAFTGSGWYLGRTFLGLMGNSGLCRIN